MAKDPITRYLEDFDAFHALAAAHTARILRSHDLDPATGWHADNDCVREWNNELFDECQALQRTADNLDDWYATQHLDTEMRRIMRRHSLIA